MLIQPSFYGTDNRALQEAVERLNGTNRGVAVLDPVLLELVRAGWIFVRLSAPFRAVDDPAVLGLLADWCPDPAARRAILATNPNTLYRFS